MLTKLTVKNYALIRELDIDLEEGLTIITGETGAGKSILLGALSLILGSRADVSVLLDKNEKCIVEGAFLTDGYGLESFFSDNELDYESVTYIRREINPAGKSRAFVNDTPVTLSVLRDLGSKLIDIHSQHQTLMLNDNRFQLSLIDSFSGTRQLISEYLVVYNLYRKAKKELSQLEESSSKNNADLEYYSFQIKQLEEAKLKEGEQEELEAELTMLNHAGEIKSALAAATERLSSDNGSVLSLLREIKLNIGRISRFIPEGDNLLSRSDSALIELTDIASELEKTDEAVQADPERQAYITSRLDLLYSLIHKHHVSDLNGLIGRKAEITRILHSIESVDEKLALLNASITKHVADLSRISHEISDKRQEVIPEIEARITTLLKQLGMPNARFRISLNRLDTFGPSGIDQADLLFSANRQIAPEDLSRIASGGELSRVMLSLKSLLASNNNLPTIIFDEIDSGVSGEVADRVGQILSSMGKHMQVINITHLPQVASRGTKHYHVFKDDSDDSTITRVKLLSHEERIIEVAKLLSGSEITDIAVQNARQLFNSAVK